MNFLKYIGIFMLSSSISAYGAIKASSLKTSFGARAEISVLIKNIEKCIKYGGTTIAEAIRNCPCQKLKKLGILDELSSTANITSKIEKNMQFLSNNDKKELSFFLTTLGKSHKSEIELKKCRYLIDYFESTMKENEKDIETKANLYRKIGLILGILTAIIFI